MPLLLCCALLLPMPSTAQALRPTGLEESEPARRELALALSGLEQGNPEGGPRPGLTHWRERSGRTDAASLLGRLDVLAARKGGPTEENILLTLRALRSPDRLVQNSAMTNLVPTWLKDPALTPYAKSIMNGLFRIFTFSNDMRQIDIASSALEAFLRSDPVFIQGLSLRRQTLRRLTKPILGEDSADRLRRGRAGVLIGLLPKPSQRDGSPPAAGPSPSSLDRKAGGLERGPVGWDLPPVVREPLEVIPDEFASAA
ncbi:MAG: hypothetical protein COV76_08005 [Candidatus Omnitrophica bacterium CG11_big_fil_rev_8_21_14_0_20_64_10]|nr:MAG: hypothetical protein COV76_08005 [Candidatus Omnitrophica bacterium CG11_big_fil_rev_8_21_14_0_20_64_10]